MKIAIGADHGGVELKDELILHLKEKGIETEDFGAYDKTSVHYPDIALKVAQCVADGEASFGILICCTGQGMNIAANKVKGIRSAIALNEYMAKMARGHNNANILCLGAQVVGAELSKSLVDVFLETAFDGGRHQIRVDKIGELE